MKKILTVLVITILVSAANRMYSQSKFQIGLSGGVVITSFEFNDDLGFGTLATLSYMPCESIGLFLSSGMITWNNMAYYKNIFNTKITPIIIGAKYYFRLNKLNTYLLFEIEQISGNRLKGFYGERNPSPYDIPGYKNYISDSVTFSDIIYAAGLGFNYKLGNNINFETAFVTSLFSNHNTSDGFHIRLFTGLNYMF